MFYIFGSFDNKASCILYLENSSNQLELSLKVINTPTTAPCPNTPSNFIKALISHKICCTIR